MNRNLFIRIGSGMFLLLLIVMLIGPYLPNIDTRLQEHVARVVGSDIQIPPYPPSLQNPFGSTDNGTDLLSLLVVGTKDTLKLVFAITIIRYIIAIPLGMAASKKKGPAHLILTGWNNLFSALPPLFSAILLLTAPFLLFNTHRMIWAIIILAVIEVGRVGYIVQQQAFDVSRKLYIDAARTMGFKSFDMYLRQYLPVLLPEIIVLFFLDMGRVLLLIGQLGVFSIFISEKWMQVGFVVAKLHNLDHNWATLLALAKGNLLQHFWLGFFPAAAIAYGILMFNLLGEGLRQYFSRNSA